MVYVLRPAYFAYSIPPPSPTKTNIRVKDATACWVVLCALPLSDLSTFFLCVCVFLCVDMFIAVESCGSFEAVLLLLYSSH